MKDIEFRNLAFRQSYAKTLLGPNPWQLREKLESQDVLTDSMLRGRIIHALSLGDDKKVVPIPYDDYKGKAARELKADALAADQLPIIQGKLESLSRAAAVVRQTIEDDCGMPMSALITERKIETKDVMWSGLPGHGTLDAIAETPVGRIIYDPKASDVQGEAFIRHASDLKYHVQASMYLHLLGDRPGDAFKFVVVQPGPPYGVTIATATSEFLMVGEFFLKRALVQFKKVRSNPGHSEPCLIDLTATSWDERKAGWGQ